MFVLVPSGEVKSQVSVSVVIALSGPLCTEASSVTRPSLLLWAESRCRAVECSG